MQQSVESKGNIGNKINVSFLFTGRKPYFDDDEHQERNCYVVTVGYNGKSTKFTYGDSIADTEAGLKPKKLDILEIITSDFYYTKEYYPTYKDFSGEMGYGEDSIKGSVVYEKCLKQGKKLHSVFSEDDIKTLREELDNNA